MIINDAVRVRVIRATTGLDSKSFAAKVGVCAGTLTSWEKGRAVPRGTTMQSLSKLCQEYKIGFTPSGFPFPIVDCMMFKAEDHNA